jgi:hypothetical protein
VIALGLWLVAEYRVLAPLAWRAWLVHLYGMETRDLRVILALAQRMGGAQNQGGRNASREEAVGVFSEEADTAQGAGITQARSGDES